MEINMGFENVLEITFFFLFSFLIKDFNFHLLSCLQIIVKVRMSDNLQALKLRH